MDVFFFFISKCNTQFGEIPDRCLIGDKVGLIKNCAYLPSHGIWQSYMYALDVSIGKQNVLGIRNSPEKPLMVGIIFCYTLIRSNINNSAIYSLNSALLNFRGAHYI
jgi:hypothetical protein